MISYTRDLINSARSLMQNKANDMSTISRITNPSILAKHKACIKKTEVQVLTSRAEHL